MQGFAGAVQFRQAVGPAGGRTVGRGGVQHTDIRPQQRHDLAGGIVRQAEERKVALIDDRRAGMDILAVSLGNMQDRKFRPFSQTVRNAQPSGAGTAIHEDFNFSHFYTPKM